MIWDTGCEQGLYAKELVRRAHKSQRYETRVSQKPYSCVLPLLLGRVTCNWERDF